MHDDMIKRFIGTDSYEEFMEWSDYMYINGINHRSKVKMIGSSYKCEIELIGYTKEEVEDIKKAIGFYLD